MEVVVVVVVVVEVVVEGREEVVETMTMEERGTSENAIELEDGLEEDGLEGGESRIWRPLRRKSDFAGEERLSFQVAAVRIWLVFAPTTRVPREREVSDLAVAGEE